jgi:hypothetical protein
MRFLAVSEVGPLESEDLVAAHAGHGGEPQDREEPMPGGGAQEQPELLVGPGAAFCLLERPLLGCSGQFGDVAGHEPAADGVVEGAADAQVDLVHGLGRQASAVGWVEEGVVEGFDLLEAQASQLDAPEGRDDVEVHVALVTAVGAGREVQLLCREPLVGEVCAEGQRPSCFVPAGLAGGEPGGEPFGFVPVGTR